MNDTRDEERELTAACLAGREAGFRAFVDRYSRLIHGICLRMLRDRHEAEDVTQEVFVRALRSLRSWDGLRPLRGWLVAIAANRCRTHLSKRKRRPVGCEHPEELPDKRAAAGDERELNEAINAAIAELRPDYQRVFLLYHEQGLSYQEMSELVGRPIGTVKIWLHRARLAILGQLKEKGLVTESQHDVSGI